MLGKEIAWSHEFGFMIITFRTKIIRVFLLMLLFTVFA